MAPHLGLFSLLASLAVTNASPFSLSPRGGLSTYVDHREDLGVDLTYFAPDWPTCANDHTLTDIGLSTTITVNVRPDCDNVIDIICKAAAAEASVPHDQQWMYSLGHTEGTCEGHIMFSQWQLADPLDYPTCVAGFQSITETCILMDDPNVKNYASDKHQFGVKNIFHNPQGGSPTLRKWNAATGWNLMPGYMMGPPNVFGAVEGRDATDIGAGGRPKVENGS